MAQIRRDITLRSFGPRWEISGKPRKVSLDARHRCIARVAKFHPLWRRSLPQAHQRVTSGDS
jgi:hypothetical protein